MAELTTHERMMLVYQHKEPDRVPITDLIWGSTLARWRREGLPGDVAWVDYFGVDQFWTPDIDTEIRHPELERPASF